MPPLQRGTLVALITMACGTTAAQESIHQNAPLPVSPKRNQDIGLFSQYSGPATSSGTAIQGIVYRHALQSHPQTFWKAGAGTGVYSHYFNSRTDTLAPNVVADISSERREQLYTLLAGVETGRHLWRGFYLTAGAELQGGGSRGGVDSVAYEYTLTSAGGAPSGSSVGTNTRLADTRTYFGGGVLSLGLRGYFGRFTVAGESIFWLRTGTAHEALRNPALPSYSSFEVNVGRGMRVSAGYRF